MRKRKASTQHALLTRNKLRQIEDRLWDQMVPVGREFGSPDFERLMEEDYQARTGVFDPVVKRLFAPKSKPT
jgi:hypothetical protein